MPGRNPDPATSIDVLDVIRETFHRDMVPAIAQAVTTSVAQITKPRSATQYESFTRALTIGVPIIVLGADRLRTRALLRGNTDDIFIGTLSQLSSGFGYPLATQQGDEILTTAEIYAVYNPQSGSPTDALIGVWLERDGE